MSTSKSPNYWMFHQKSSDGYSYNVPNYKKIVLDDKKKISEEKEADERLWNAVSIFKSLTGSNIEWTGEDEIDDDTSHSSPTKFFEFKFENAEYNITEEEYNDLEYKQYKITDTDDTGKEIEIEKTIDIENHGNKSMIDYILFLENQIKEKPKKKNGTSNQKSIGMKKKENNLIKEIQCHGRTLSPDETGYRYGNSKQCTNWSVWSGGYCYKCLVKFNKLGFLRNGDIRIYGKGSMPYNKKDEENQTTNSLWKSPEFTNNIPEEFREIINPDKIKWKKNRQPTTKEKDGQWEGYDNRIIEEIKPDLIKE